MPVDVRMFPRILATAGHVDHGKSALVKALTGVDPHRLPEEKRRGVTIELGFASLRLPTPPSVTPAGEYQVGIVDVPGHEDFVKNMVAGVGSIDAALLVVAADDEWMPQTEEHLQILTYLGVRHGVIALSKIDLAADETASVASIRARLRGTPLETSQIVPTSVVTGQGLNALRRALSEMFAVAPPQGDLGKPRLPVDRVFSIKGVGTVVTGTLTGGTLRRGQAVLVQPGNSPARIRTVQTYSREVDVAEPGSRVALNLPDLHPATGGARQSGHGIARGDVVTIANLGDTIQLIDVIIERLPDRLQAEAGIRVTPAIQGNKFVQVHHGTRAVRARVHLYDTAPLKTGASGLARLALDAPVLALAGDCIVIRDWSAQHTLGGGIVLDTAPPTDLRRSSPRRAAHLALLQARAAAPADLAGYVLTRLARDGVAPRVSLLQQSRLSEREIIDAIDHLIERRAVIAAGNHVAGSDYFATLRGRFAQAVDAYHRNHPEQLGLSVSDARAAVIAADWRTPPSAAQDLFDAVANELTRSEFVRSGSVIRRSSHHPALPPRLQLAGQKLREQLADRPLDPPSRKELAGTDLAYQALKFLLATGEAIEIGPELVISADAYAHAIRAIRSHLASGNSATVSELKTLLVTSRRVMVPLLEYLDRNRVTQREGDRRRLKGTH